MLERTPLPSRILSTPTGRPYEHERLETFFAARGNLARDNVNAPSVFAAPVDKEKGGVTNPALTLPVPNFLTCWQAIQYLSRIICLDPTRKLILSFTSPRSLPDLFFSSFPF